jgi:hypothetical protein
MLMPIRPQCFKALLDLRDSEQLDPSAAVAVLDRFYPDAQKTDAWWAPDGVSVTVFIDAGVRTEQETIPPAPPPDPIVDASPPPIEESP